MAKKAVLIGCNYPGTKAALRGCINDVWSMHRCLINRYGFSEEDITVLIDTDHSYSQPTGKNIRSALYKLVLSAKPGDVLFVHYSGHGTRLPSETGEEDDTGYDECIVPTDMNLITDDDIRKIVDKTPHGCRITILSDSCHSGGLIEAAKEQIGQSTKKGGQCTGHGFGSFLGRNVEGGNEESHVEHPHKNYGYMRNRSLSLTTLIDILKQKTGEDDLDVGKLRPTLFYLFGEDASSKVKNFMKFVLNKLQQHEGGILGMVGTLAQELLKQKLDEDDDEEYTQLAKEKNVIQNGGILLSGCQSDQTSADATPSEDSDGAYGAFSNAIQMIIKETDGAVTNRELVLKARKKLRRQGYTQKPGLYCSDQHVDAPFVC